MKFFTSVLLATASIASARLTLTGDIINGYPVVSSLDINALPPNTISRVWITAAESQGGINYYLPVFIARGTNESALTGRKLSLSASIHGDELNGIPVVQRIFSQLNSSGIVTSGNFNGTVIGIPTMNPNGNQHNQRNFFTATSNGFLVNLNRVFPGRSVLSGGSIAQSYASTIWNQVWGNTSNVDIAVDLHTLSTGSNGPLWAYADFRLPGVQRLAELSQADIIKIDPGEPGSVETTFVDYGIPAITLEIGPAKNWNGTKIRRSQEFIMRLMEDLGMMAGNGTAGSSDVGSVQVDLRGTYKATNVSSVSVTRTGWIEMSVDVLQDVRRGDQVGTVYNSWGDVIEVLTAPVAGRVLTVRTDPAVEMGAGVLDLAYNATITA